MKKKNTTFSGFVKVIVVLLAVLIATYILIYFCFKGNGFIPTGDNLEKRDWLSFLGAYLSFSGTIIVSIIALLEGYFYRQLFEKTDIKKRKNEIQPIFSIKIKEFNTGVGGYAEAISLSNPSKNKKHENFTIEIENVGIYPIKHVIVFDRYIVQLLKSNEPKRMQCAYEDSPDYSHESKQLIRILQSEYGRAENGLPKWFNINYEDIDGNDMYQTFELKEFDGEQYYALTSTNEA